MQITEPRGSSWTLTPHFSGLSAAQGGFTTALGWFGASWEINGQKITVGISTHSRTKGVVIIPGDISSVRVDGKARRGRREPYDYYEHELDIIYDLFFFNIALLML